MSASQFRCANVAAEDALEVFESRLLQYVLACSYDELPPLREAQLLYAEWEGTEMWCYFFLPSRRVILAQFNGCRCKYGECSPRRALTDIVIILSLMFGKDSVARIVRHDALKLLYSLAEGLPVEALDGVDIHVAEPEVV